MAVTDLTNKLDVSRETLDKLESYAALLRKWQPAKNLVANSTLDDLWNRHFLDSAQLAPLIRARKGEGPFTFLDIGSGAGFPGLVLSAMQMGQAHMVESNHKKSIFMGQVARACGLGAEIHQNRIEDLPSFPVDFITSRACATVGKLLDWAHPFIGKSTDLWLLKGAKVDDELTLAQKSWNMDCEQFESLTDKTGVVLRIYNIKTK